MWQLRMMRKTLTTDAVKTLVQALVVSRLDYCNSIFHLISAACELPIPSLMQRLALS